MSKFRPVQLLAIPAIAFLGRVAGASWGPRQVGEVSTSLAIAYVSFLLWGDLLPYYLVPILAAISSYAGIQDGHGNVYHMGTLEKEYANSPRGLDRKFGWIGRLFGAPRSPAYCWALMGIKGLWIGLPLFPFGLALAFFWPASYYLSFKAWRDSLPAEWITHGILGIVLIIGYNYGT